MPQRQRQGGAEARRRRAGREQAGRSPLTRGQIGTHDLDALRRTADRTAFSHASRSRAPTGAAMVQDKNEQQPRPPTAPQG